MVSVVLQEKSALYAALFYPAKILESATEATNYDQHKYEPRVALIFVT